MAETEPAKEKVKKQLRQEENVELLGATARLRMGDVVHCQKVQ